MKNNINGRTMKKVILAFAAFSLLLSGCVSQNNVISSMSNSQTSAPVSSIEVTGKSEVNVGCSTQLSASGGSGAFDWYSENLYLASVDQQGKVTGINPGIVKIFAASSGEKGSIEITITDNSQPVHSQKPFKKKDPESINIDLYDPISYSAVSKSFKINLNDYVVFSEDQGVTFKITSADFGVSEPDETSSFDIKADSVKDGKVTVDVLQDGKEQFSLLFSVSVENSLPYQLKNGGFDNGTIDGWTSVTGNAFTNSLISQDTYQTAFASIPVPYNNDGYFYNGFTTADNRTGLLRSSTFVLGGTGLVSFKLGGAKEGSLTYISFKRLRSGTSDEEIARYNNTKFYAPAKFTAAEIGKEVFLTNMVSYKCDLSAYLGDTLYVELVDKSITDWGLMCIDSFQTYHRNSASIADFTEAVNILPSKKTANAYQIQNGDFETGDLTGWTDCGQTPINKEKAVSSQKMFTLLNDIRVPYNQTGNYHYDGMKASGAESDSNAIKSTSFILGGSGWITFKMGGNAAVVKVYNSSNVLLKSIHNTEYLNNYYGNVDYHCRVITMTTFAVDLSAYLNQRLYLVLEDKGAMDWGLAYFDDVVTFYAEAPDYKNKYDTVECYRYLNPSSILFSTKFTYNIPWATCVDTSLSEGDFDSLSSFTMINITAESAEGNLNSESERNGYPVNNSGTYYFEKGPATGYSLTTPVFVLDGSGQISFRLGGNGATVKVFTYYGKLIGQYTNTSYGKAGKIGDMENTMTTYFATFSSYLYQKLYLTIDFAPEKSAMVDEINVYHSSAVSASSSDSVSYNQTNVALNYVEGTNSFMTYDDSVITANKTMLTIGDSILDLTDNVSDGSAQRIAFSTGYYNLYRDNISGSTIGDFYKDGIVSHLQSGFYDKLLDGKTPDIILVERGTNDLALWDLHQKPGDASTVGDTNTTYGAIAYVCKTLRTKYPKARIIWSTPLYRHDYSQNVVNAFSKMLNEICPGYNIEVFDLNKSSGIDSSNTGLYQGDGVHLVPAGLVLYIEAWVKYINN